MISGRQDPGKTFKNKKMAGHLGDERVTTLNLRVVELDIERGLILVEGAVPGTAGGWIYVRDAVKKALPKKRRRSPANIVWQMLLPAARPGKRRGPAREDRHDLPLVRRTTAGSIDLDDAIFGLVPREDLIARMVRYQLAKRRAGTHQTLGRADIWRTGKKLYKQGTGSREHGSAGCRSSGGGRALGRACARTRGDLHQKLRGLARRLALSAKAQDGAIIVWPEAHAGDAARPIVEGEFRQPWLDQRLDHRRSGTRGKLPACRAQHPAN